MLSLAWMLLLIQGLMGKPLLASHPGSVRWKKEDFLAEYAGAGEYGYGKGEGGSKLEVDELRPLEFPHLLDPQSNPSGLVYLDHAGATLYSKSQIACHSEMLMQGIYGNPHSKGPVASLTADLVDSVRGAVLEHFNASHEHWVVVFTSGATASFKLLAESFPWSRESCLYYALNSHNSVLGMREQAIEAGGLFKCLPSDPAALTQHLLDTWAVSGQYPGGEGVDDTEKAAHEDMLVLPGECNFSGRKVDVASLSALPRVRNGRQLWVVLDAAKLAATSPLDLHGDSRVDALCLSFYKLFGFPTGVGCLLLRRGLAERLTAKAYFGGGTVQAALPDRRFQVLRSEPERRLVDGTENFLGILGVGHGLKLLQARGMGRIQAHTFALTRFLYHQLDSLAHGNGARVCELYGPSVESPGEHGPILAFNLKRPSGEYVGYAEVERLAELHGIQLRTGCFCNPGACMEALGLSHEDVLANLQAGHVCWDDHDLVDGKPTGAIRVSLGYMSTWEDCVALLHLIDKYFLSKTTAIPRPTPFSQATPAGPPSSVRLSSLVIYPIKSCAGMAADRWPLGPSGLLFDREWALVDSNGRALRLKACPSMCRLRPRVCLETQSVVVQAPGMEELRFSLSAMPPPERSQAVSVCGEACAGVAYDAIVSSWFSRYLGVACTLVRNSPYAQSRKARTAGDRQKQQEGQAGETGEGEGGREKTRLPIAFANEAQFLLVSTASVDHLNGLIAHQVDLDYEFRYQGDKSESYVTIENFRPNLVVSGGVAHQEDLWQAIEIGEGSQGMCLRVTGPCSRCSMVNIDHRDGSKAVPVLKTLATYRRDKSMICFGQFLTMSRVAGEGQVWLEVGLPVRPLMNGGDRKE